MTLEQPSSIIAEQLQAKAGSVAIAPISSLVSQSARHALTLRHEASGEYHQLLLFSFPRPPHRSTSYEHASSSSSRSSDEARAWYCMEAVCPHAGGPLENATLESVEKELEDEARQRDDIGKHEADVEDLVVVCPWHEYDFSLRTGKSTRGGQVKACVYSVEIRPGPERNLGSQSLPLKETIRLAQPGIKAKASRGGTSPSEPAAVQRSDKWIWVEAPRLEAGFEWEARGQARGWTCIEVRPVSEAFAQPHRESQIAAKAPDAALSESMQELSFGSQIIPPEASASLPSRSMTRGAVPSAKARDHEAYPPPNPEPKTIVAWACLILNTASPTLKVHYTKLAYDAFLAGKCTKIGGGSWRRKERRVGEDGGDEPGSAYGGPSASSWEWHRSADEIPPEKPPRQTDNVVKPGFEAKRGKGGTERGRIALLHSLANIEQWAIDLAWDMVAISPHLYAEALSPPSTSDSSQTHKALRPPLQMIADFVRMAADEAKHFTLLCERLESLGVKFGDLTVHHGLWETARDTRHCLAARLSVVHLVHEARGLDVNPTTISRFVKAGDEESVKSLTIIHEDEVTHVSTGHRWLVHLCQAHNPPQDPVQVFRQKVRENFSGTLREPFNELDRARAGLDKQWYDGLRGQKRTVLDGDSRSGVQDARVAQIAGG
ncbi:3-OXOACYL-[ACYL-CARRIER-PROTEIN] SYNTHASE-LIKE PROTEIN [Ceraceosorus bombacis]|uniref:3-OXOACYL-[ACYL-CARRIER-PROTEIN] SYNTHASE-LIKE PROTEIN n=1 Tax=Ceraceosorus bombacis TaxID=401625 RepID=A0A0P1BSW2_9BASI|nr:3-OXOACYL-[ACYL-CARRIER-PROTEIN] SYNTHASE-LIKE PROTEIN [Ceraceosorus bombacis]